IDSPDDFVSTVTLHCHGQDGSPSGHRGPVRLRCGGVCPGEHVPDGVHRATGGMVDLRRPSFGLRGTGVGFSSALFCCQHAVHQGPQALAPARGGAPGTAWRRDSAAFAENPGRLAVTRTRLLGAAAAAAAGVRSRSGEPAVPSAGGRRRPSAERDRGLRARSFRIEPVCVGGVDGGRGRG
ncbi:unnamed protein product, partial [Scytosiphon promiscuus]